MKHHTKSFVNALQVELTGIYGCIPHKKLRIIKRRLTAIDDIIAKQLRRKGFAWFLQNKVKLQGQTKKTRTFGEIHHNDKILIIQTRFSSNPIIISYITGVDWNVPK